MTGGPKQRLLEEASFGERIAEDEVRELADYFVETDQWRRLSSGEADIVYGPKGAGKSALYSLLVQRSDQLFDKGILLVTAESPSGTPAFRDIADEPPTSEAEFVALWKAYFLSLVAAILQDYGVATAEAARVYTYLEGARLPHGKASLRSRLRAVREFVSRMSPEAVEGGVLLDTTGNPVGVTGKISLREPTIAMRADGFVSIDELLEDANVALGALDFRVWLLLDRLDVAFLQHEDLEKNALRALFKAYLDMKPLDQISLKIFLRTDIWERITEEGFREASHITASITITWDDQSLMQLMLRRILRNPRVAEFYGVDPDAVFSSVAQQETLFKRIVPDQVDRGKAPKTFDWMRTRTQDGSRQTAPRELIHLLTSLRESELKRIEVGHDEPDDEALFDRQAFKDALREVSEVRLKQTMYSEYPDDRPHIEAMHGAKAQQTPASLMGVWNANEPRARFIADRLVQLGFFERRGTRDEPIYWVPFLYRDVLGLIQGEAKIES
jgi:hypothetical protein